MKRTPAIAAALFALALAARAAEKTPAPGGPVPVPYPDTTTTSPAPVSLRDPASGLPTGKRMHRPWVFSASARKMPLADGRVFVVNAETGEVVFGDGVQGKRPETGNVPIDGRYRLGGGAAGNVDVRSGRIVTPTPVPTRAPARAR